MQIDALDAGILLPPLAGRTAPEVPLADRDAKHAETAKQFEALLATQLVKELRRGLSTGFFGEGPGSDVYDGWLDRHVGESLAESWRLDLAGMVKADLDGKQARLERARAGSAGGVE